MNAVPGTAERLPVHSDADLSSVRQRVRTRAQEVGFGLVQQTKLVTAASELARNTLVHGGGGEVEMAEVVQSDRRGLRLRFVDSGPGLTDVALALTDGYTTGNGLGMGLGGARRLVHEFDVDTAVGKGTTVTIVAWNAAPAGGSAGRR